MTGALRPVHLVDTLMSELGDTVRRPELLADDVEIVPQPETQAKAPSGLADEFKTKGNRYQQKMPSREKSDVRALISSPSSAVSIRALCGAMAGMGAY